MPDEEVRAVTPRELQPLRLLAEVRSSREQELSLPRRCSCRKQRVRRQQLNRCVALRVHVNTHTRTRTRTRTRGCS